MAPNGLKTDVALPPQNYCAYTDPQTGLTRMGSLSEDGTTIHPLAYHSGTPVTSLYEVIEVGSEGLIVNGDPVQQSQTKVLPPINGRDILCVGKNYADHAKEFNSSGFDSSDKADQPTHPVIFTKRFSSIIADGDDIFPHPNFTNTIDFEGELGVIIGKPGFRISESDAMDHVWGYTIINDMTARERQRDHKQFYIGKSPDTFCPMGPIAVPKEKLEQTLRVQTRVNGNLMQNATTDQLIFSIPYLIMTLSEGQTLMPGDVLATGTPAGVGIGKNPPVYLQPGDEIKVSITGLGTLTNRIASPSSINPTVDRVNQKNAAQASNTSKSASGFGLTTINGKPTNYLHSGTDGAPAAVFVHGLGGTVDYWTPLIDSAGLKSTHSLHLFDFEGHGLSPTSPLSALTIQSLAQDVHGVFTHAGIQSGATLFAHSLGCLIAVQFVLEHPGMVSKLVLIGPPPSPLPSAGRDGSFARAALARSRGMKAVVDAVVDAGTSQKTKTANPLAVAATRQSLLGQDPEGYAKACWALAKSSETTLDFGKIDAATLIVTGSEDKVSPPQLCESYEKGLVKSSGLVVLQDVGHWHVFEDTNGVVEAVSKFLN